MNILLMIVMPLIVISVLSSAFTDLMKRYDENDITAGYVIENDAVNDKMEDALIKAVHSFVASLDLGAVRFAGTAVLLVVAVEDLLVGSLHGHTDLMLLVNQRREVAHHEEHLLLDRGPAQEHKHVLVAGNIVDPLESVGIIVELVERFLAAVQSNRSASLP